jgi:hypothetical protein
MLVPVLISRSVLVVGTRKNTEFVSVSFIARFADGSEKILNSTAWQVKGLLKECETGLENVQVLSPDVCTLYWRNWSNVVSGKNNFKTHYPSPCVIPDEVAACI